MFHRIETEEDENGKMYIKAIVFDVGDALESYWDCVRGYEGKTIHQLVAES